MVYIPSFKQLLRTIKRNLGAHIINILGLTISITSCLLIFLFIHNELSYDRHFKEAEHLYRLYFKGQMGGNYLEAATTGGSLGRILKDELPEVTSYTRFIQYPRSVLIGVGENKFYQENILYADSTFFGLFDYAFLEGDPSNALVNPKTVVMTEVTASKYFGKGTPVGQMIRWNNEESYLVTGVIRQPEHPSHLQFDMLVSHATLRAHPVYGSHIDNPFSFMTYNYMMLRAGTDINDFNNRIEGIIEKYMGEDMHAIGADLHYYIQPVTSIHLHSHLIHEIKENGHLYTVWIFAGIALLILLSACINFVNLTTARSSFRALEVGIRKVYGADRKNLIWQFLSETFAIALISLLLSVLLLILLEPVIERVLDAPVFFSPAILGYIIPLLLFFTVLIAFLAGIYPALYLSAFRPIQVMKGDIIRGKKNPLFRNTMVTLQFLITLFLITSTLIIFQQLRYLRKMDLGFDMKGIIVTPLRNQQMVRDFKIVKGELSQLPGVEEVTAFSAYPGNYQQRRGYYPEGQPTTNMWMVRNVQVDHNFLHMLRIPLAEGRDFSPTGSVDSASVIVNRSLVEKLEWTNPLGKHITLPGAGDTEGTRFTIIGVTEDFHYASLHEKVEPLIIHLDPANFRFIGIKIEMKDTKNTLDGITKKWEILFPDYPFDYFLLDNTFNQQYASETRLAGVFTNFTYLAVFIACLGLFGLVSFITTRRTREFGIRKVLGAGIRDILVLVNINFVYLVLIASLVSLPLSVYAMYRWLGNFAFHTHIAWWNLLVPVLITTMMAMAIISSVAYRLARKNPVEAIQYV